jgi:photosystem II stability/assembly factor-like uncharacterized protein
MFRKYLTNAFLGFVFCICGLETTSAQWKQTSGTILRGVGTETLCFTVFGTDLYTGTFSSGLFRTSDAGATWSDRSNGLPDGNIVALCASGGNLLAARNYPGEGHIMLTKDGWNWTQAVVDSTVGRIRNMCVCGNSIVAAAWEDGYVLRSTDNGAHWTRRMTNLPKIRPLALACRDTTLFAAVWSFGLYRSDDYGATWTDMTESAPNTNITRLAVVGGDLFAGTDVGMYRSSDNGESWTEINTGLPTIPITYHVTSIVSRGENLFISASSFGVYVSHNRGDSWTAINDGLKNLNITAIGVQEPWLYCGDDTSLICRRGLAEVASADRVSEAVPSHLKLEQNYPNPVNPTTTIEFSVPQSGFVSLRVFNVFGAVVSTLVSEELCPGVYRTNWDAGGLAGGVYFYRLEQGRYVETKKLAVGK